MTSISYIYDLSKHTYDINTKILDILYFVEIIEPAIFLRMAGFTQFSSLLIAFRREKKRQTSTPNTPMTAKRNAAPDPFPVPKS